MNRTLSLSLVIGIALAAGVTSAADLVSVKPAALDFGNVPQGKSATLALRLKTSAALSVSIKVLTPVPYLADPAQLTMQSLSFSEISVTLPRDAELGNHSGKIILQLTPVGVGKNVTENLEIPVSGNVITPPPQDLTAAGRLKSCSAKNGLRSCEVDLQLATTLPGVVKAKTLVFETHESEPETKTLDKPLDFQPSGGAPFVYEISELPKKVRKVTLRIVIDPEKQIAAEDASNNEVILAIDIPK